MIVCSQKYHSTYIFENEIAKFQNKVSNVRANMPNHFVFSANAL